MPVHKRELAYRSNGLDARKEDWWHLVLETDPPGLYVEHTWAHATLAPDQVDRGAERFGINDFLSMGGEEVARDNLLRTLPLMFGAEPPPA